jgi:hypothetical protein
MLDLPQHRLLEEQGALCGLHHSHSGPSRTTEQLWNLNFAQIIVKEVKRKLSSMAKKGDIVQNIIQVYQPNKYSGHSPGSN